jgi:ribonuclease P protein component
MTNHSIPRSLSSFSKSEIRLLFANARTIVRHPHLEIARAPRIKSYGRILLIIPKKVGSAPERNKLKRQLKALFYEAEWHTKEYDLIVSAKMGATRLSFDQLKELLASTFKGSRGQ